MSPGRTTSNQTVAKRDSGGGAAVPDEPLSKERQEQLDLLEKRIQQAAREVVASIELDNPYLEGVEASYTDGSELTYSGTDGTELTHGSGDVASEMDRTHDDSVVPSECDDESASARSPPLSNHDADIEDHDDVFSRLSSSRSSLDSGEHDGSGRLDFLNSPVVGEEANDSPKSYNITHKAQRDDPQTPSKGYATYRPAFRTPSSVRAIQMASPACTGYLHWLIVERSVAMQLRCMCLTFATCKGANKRPCVQSTCTGWGTELQQR